MTDQFANNMLRALGKELEEQPEKVWLYCSFADEEEFKGGIIVKAHGVIDASLMTHRLGINPGGQMAVRDIPDESVPDKKWQNRLLSKKEVDEAFSSVIQ